jgi:hypothetical protein
VRRPQFSSVHTVDHLRPNPSGRSRCSASSAFHVSTVIITTTRVIWFKNVSALMMSMWESRIDVCALRLPLFGSDRIGVGGIG